MITIENTIPLTEEPVSVQAADIAETSQAPSSDAERVMTDEQDSRFSDNLRLSQEAEALREYYPSFDLRHEASNPRFRSLIATPGVSVREAFELVHRDELLASAMQYAARGAERNVIEKLKRNTLRPDENGSIRAAASARRPAALMTRSERAELIRRARGGERIEL